MRFLRTAAMLFLCVMIGFVSFSRSASADCTSFLNGFQRSVNNAATAAVLAGGSLENQMRYYFWQYLSTEAILQHATPEEYFYFVTTASTSSFEKNESNPPPQGDFLGHKGAFAEVTYSGETFIAVIEQCRDF
ncbi:MAG: hypothetical protein F6J86_09895 [Symploca sp. SIO1B1]|nr:hypothetical protein [Symploca sp. SIO1B1]